MRVPVPEITNDREREYGAFVNAARVAQVIKHQLRAGAAQSGAHINAEMSEAFDMMATNMSRIVSGAPTDADHWKAIAGYATLVAEKLEGK